MKHDHQWERVEDVSALVLGERVVLERLWSISYVCRICREPGYDASPERLAYLRARWGR